MGDVVAGYASSHAFTFVEPAGWERLRTKNRETYTRLYGAAPPLLTSGGRLDVGAAQYMRIRDSLQRLRERIRTDRLDCLVIVGDDQNENFDETALPQIAVYTGEDFTLAERFAPGGLLWPSARAVSWDIASHAVDAGYDVTNVVRFREGVLRSHAHGDIITNILGAERIPVVLVFLNALHMPALSPQRCLGLGAAIAGAIRERRPAGQRVGIYASGGLSHFTAGYPWSAYRGPHVHGSIDSDFDRRILSVMASGGATELGDLTSDELLATGNIETRAWICAVGAVGGNRRWSSVYEPIPEAIMGMAVAHTDAQGGA